MQLDDLNIRYDTWTSKNTNYEAHYYKRTGNV